MIRLDELEQKAKAVNCPETWNEADFIPDDGPIDGAFIGAMSPTTALALIRVVRAAKEMFAFGEEGKCLTTQRWMEIKEALKEIECN